LGDTFIINSQTASSTHATVLREGNGRFPSQFFSAPEVGVTNFFSKVPHYTVTGIQGGFRVGRSEPGYWNLPVNSLRISIWCAERIRSRLEKI
jgi:hypothetical protein